MHDQQSYESSAIATKVENLYLWVMERADAALHNVSAHLLSLASDENFAQKELGLIQYKKSIHGAKYHHANFFAPADLSKHQEGMVST